MIMAYPHPRARSCCCQVGPLVGPQQNPANALVPPGAFVPAAPPANRFVADMALVPRNRPKAPKLKPNSSMSGTGACPSAGVVKVRSMFTLINGYEELST